MCPNFTMCDRSQKESEEKKTSSNGVSSEEEGSRRNKSNNLEHAVFNCLRKAAT